MQNRVNAFKVGIAIVAAVAIFFFGVRYFQNIPINRGTYELRVEFNEVDGLVTGNPVQVNGVRVGSVTNVSINPETRRVQVHLRIDNKISVPEDSDAELAGFSSLGVVRVAIDLGRSDVMLKDGEYIRADEESLLSSVPAIAENYMGKIDSVLIGLTGNLSHLDSQLGEPRSDLRQTLSSLNGLTTSLDAVIRTEKQRLSAILANLESTLSNTDALTAGTRDSLSQTMAALNQTLHRADQTLIGLQAASSNLTIMLTKINSGEGSLGLMVNNPSLYHNMDSTLVNLNRLLVDFRENPKRYLRNLKPIDIF